MGIDKVIKSFMVGKPAKDGNVSTDGEVFRSYSMVIATRKGGDCVMVPYEDCPSVTTKRHWNKIKRAMM